MHAFHDERGGQTTLDFVPEDNRSTSIHITHARVINVCRMAIVNTDRVACDVALGLQDILGPRDGCQRAVHARVMRVQAESALEDVAESCMACGRIRLQLIQVSPRIS